MKNNVLFEIGIEELPARFIDEAEQYLKEQTKQWLTGLRINFASIETYSTPRRLAILIKDIAAYQTSIVEEVRGPAEKIAKDTDGNWTKAAIGFTKGQGKTTEDIYLKEEKSTNYIFIKKQIDGVETKSLLPDFKKIILSIPFKQTMRWNVHKVRFARPIRWLVALYNEEVIPFEIANVNTGRNSNGHRFLGGKVTLSNPLEYEKSLRDSYVIVDKKEREEMILTGIKELEENHECTIEVDQELLLEVRNLVEFPTVFFGKYDQAFLEVPAEVLITSMKEHQRYFPVMDSENQLLPYFVGVRNGDDFELETVIHGNEKVLRARLSDAKFFYEEDLKQSIDFYQEKLTRLVFQEKLGTVYEKVERVVRYAEQLADLLHLNEQDKTKVKRAATIAKFDLMTNMVGEFPELQGVIGEKYALYFGEEESIAKAVREHYLPVQSNGTLPESTFGAILSLADKLDTIIGFISVGLTPTGSQDPFSLRRQATGVLRILQKEKWDIPLETLFKLGYEQYQMETNIAEIQNQLHAFFELRATYLLRENSIEQDVIQSLFSKEIGVFSYQVDKANLLSQKRNDPTFKPIEEALVRVINIAKQGENLAVSEELMETESERNLYSIFNELKASYNQATAELNAEKALTILAAFASPINEFFDNNMVMVDDEVIRNNRLSLLWLIANLINDYADLSCIQWKQHN